MKASLCAIVALAVIGALSGCMKQDSGRLWKSVGSLASEESSDQVAKWVESGDLTLAEVEAEVGRGQPMDVLDAINLRDLVESRQAMKAAGEWWDRLEEADASAEMKLERRLQELREDRERRESEKAAASTVN